MVIDPSKEPEEVIMPLGMVNAGHPAFGLSGRVADTWAMFEFHVDRIIWRLAVASDGAGACITTQMVSVHNRLRALRALVELAGGSKTLLEQLDSIAGRSQEVSEERNRMVHDPWMLNATKNTVGKMRITAKKKLHFAYVPVSIPDVEALISKINSHMQRFFKFEEQLWSEFSPSLDKSPTPPPEMTPEEGHP